MNKKKIYISGAISNDANYRVKFVRKYRELEKKYTVLTPLMINAQLSWKDYMRIDLAMINVCDVVYMLDDWETSKGAKIEQFYAEMLGKEIIYQSEQEDNHHSCWNCIHRFTNGGNVPCSTCDGDGWEYKNYED